MKNMTEPEFKREIKRLSKHIVELQKTKGELTDKVKELEILVKKLDEENKLIKSGFKNDCKEVYTARRICLYKIQL